jgi:nucleoid-associated protein YgaU
MRRAWVFLLILLLAFSGLGIYGLRFGWFGQDRAGKQTASAPGETKTPGKESAAKRPIFDIVRAEPDGSVVMAGRAEPGWIVTVESGGKEVGQAKADDNGEWILDRAKRLEKGEHSLSLSARSPDGARTVFSPQRLALSLSEPKGGQPLVALTEEGKATRVIQVPPAEASAGSGAAPSPQTARFDSASKVPANGSSAAAPQNQVGFASVDYEDAGEKSMLHLNGHAQPGSRVMLYVDNQFAGAATVDATGSWSFSNNRQLGGGSHALRADLIGKDTKVLARAEVEFNRVPPTAAALAEVDSKTSDYYIGAGGQKPGKDAKTAAAQPGKVESARPKSNVIIVRAGDTLWQIAQRHYGDGAKYTQIFKNNRNQIRNPNWIYPDQRFELPQ